MLEMLFPEGSAIATACIAEHVPPDVLSAALRFDQLSFDCCIGEGAFSRVYGATYCGEPVAVKQLSRDRAELDVVHFIDEVAIMRELNHPNVVRFVGTVWEPSAMLVLERLDRSLKEALRDRRPLDVKVVAADVARGMRYLHALELSHRDLKVRPPEPVL